jgi:hypothetical protein
MCAKPRGRRFAPVKRSNPCFLSPWRHLSKTLTRHFIAPVQPSEFGAASAFANSTVCLAARGNRGNDLCPSACARARRLTSARQFSRCSLLKRSPDWSSAVVIGTSACSAGAKAPRRAPRSVSARAEAECFLRQHDGHASESAEGRGRIILPAPVGPRPSSGPDRRFISNPRWGWITCARCPAREPRSD